MGSTLGVRGKLTLGFALPVVLVLLLSFRTAQAVSELGAQQDHGAQLGQDTQAIGEVEVWATGLYAVIGDSMINRDLQSTRASATRLRRELEAHQEGLRRLGGSGARAGTSARAAKALEAYTSFFTERMVPLEEAGKYDDAIALDAEVDRLRGEALVPLHDLRAQVNDEARAADRRFDEVRLQLTWTSVVLGLVVLVVCLFTSIVLTRHLSVALVSVSKSMTRGAADVSSAAAQVSTSSSSLAEGAVKQASAASEAETSLLQMSKDLRTSAESAQHASSVAASAMEAVSSTERALHDSVAHMHEVSAAGGEISRIVKSIDEIAFQTNLLALNAAVEAARAGEAGAGFAVVANEVRALALRSAESAKQTQELIGTTVTRIEAGQRLVDSSSTSFRQVVNAMKTIQEMVADVSSSTGRVLSASEEVKTSVGHVSGVAQGRSEERRVGKECRRLCRSRWSPYH
jgi:hypothetical protein